MATPDRVRQHVRYVAAGDGARLAWAETGAGPLVVKAANWLTHLEYEWESPVWRHWLDFFGGQTRFVRYDERGCGMSEWRDSPLSLDRWADDLSLVVDAARPTAPVTLLGISQGASTCLHYALRDPDRVAGLILYGGYARGVLKRGTPDAELAFRAMVDLARVAWGRDNPTFRQVFTSRFIPDGTHEQLQWFNDLCLKTTRGDVVSALLEARAVIDIEDALPQIRVPTLVVHARHDEVIPIAEGRLLAAAIPNAEFVELDSRNHILLAHEPAWARFRDAVESFLGPSGGDVFGALSSRERQVLALMADGLSNGDIAAHLQISEKTVRNHASNLFDKLGVWSRAQAIVFARDRGFVA
ncbi:MAG: alpha/beta fold hydrolase [Acidobacteria bacterium]|nr:alpha/beta fold hydrolase [Acidobacteriota bacterium]